MIHLLNRLPPIQVHPILIVFIIISILTGTFIHLFIIITIVLWHELGHYVMARFFNWRIDSIVLWVFGGVMKTEEHGTCHLHEDVLVTLAGPLQHILIFGFLFLGDQYDLISPAILNLAQQYNIVILLFNLLPIYPLDGGKLLFHVLSIYIPYRKAYHTTLIFSMVSTILFIIIQLILYPFTLSAILIMLFILFENRIEWKNRFFVFRRFLLKRIEPSAFKKKTQLLLVQPEERLIDIFSLFKREREHIIHVKYQNGINKLTEKECLVPFFYDKKLIIRVGEIKSH